MTNFRLILTFGFAGLIGPASAAILLLLVEIGWIEEPLLARTALGPALFDISFPMWQLMWLVMGQGVFFSNLIIVVTVCANFLFFVCIGTAFVMFRRLSLLWRSLATIAVFAGLYMLVSFIFGQVL